MSTFMESACGCGLGLPLPLHIHAPSQNSRFLPSFLPECDCACAAAIATMMMGRSPFLRRTTCWDSPLSAPLHKSKLLFEPKKSSSPHLLHFLQFTVPFFTLVVWGFVLQVKQFHPDVTGATQNSDAIIRRVIQAYEILSNHSKSEIIERECMDPFGQPECEAYDIFVNEVLCIGKGCPYSCVSTAPHAFKFSSATGTARATTQGHAEDYQVQRAVGQCPRTCIHYVTPSQRIILEELLGSILNMPYDTSAEAEFFYSLIVKAQYENNRYQRPKKNPKVSSKHVDWL